MKTATIIFFLSIASAEAREVLKLPDLLAKMEKARAEKAIEKLYNREKKDHHVDWYVQHFLLDEKEKIAHIIYVLSNEKTIDGELAFHVTRMFGYRNIDEGKYDKKLARKRIKTIKDISLTRIEGFITCVGGSLNLFEKNLSQFEESL